MKQLITQLRWQMVILLRNNLIYISIAVTVIYAFIFYFIKDLPNTDRFLVLLIYNDPAIIGLFFIGLMVIMEKNDEVLPALFVTPNNHHLYLLSRILALSIIGWACASGMTLAMMGLEISWMHFSMGVFGTCLLFCFVGIMLVSYTTEFLHFMLRSIPILLFLSLPLLNYFQLTDISAFSYLPTQGPLQLIIGAFQNSIDSDGLWFAYGSMLFWTPILYFFVYRVFVTRIIKAS